MATTLTFKVDGLEGVLDRMRALPVRYQKSGARRATRKAANIIRDSARAKASRIDDPKTPAAFWRNIVVQESRRGKRLGGILMRVGVMGGSVTRRGARRESVPPGGKIQHWRHLELGTERTRAQPFMRPAMQNNASAAFDVWAEELGNELDRLTAKLAATRR